MFLNIVSNDKTKKIREMHEM